MQNQNFEFSGITKLKKKNLRKKALKASSAFIIINVIIIRTEIPEEVFQPVWRLSNIMMDNVDPLNQKGWNPNYLDQIIYFGVFFQCRSKNLSLFDM